MYKMLQLIILLTLSQMLSGCFLFTNAVTREVENAQYRNTTPQEERAAKALRKLKDQGPADEETKQAIQQAAGTKKVAVGPAVDHPSDKANLTCRLIHSIGPQIGKTFAGTLQEKMVQTLTEAGAYDDKAENVITAEIKKVAAGFSAWEFEVELKSTNGKTLTIASQSKIEIPFTGFGGENACNHAQDALGPAYNQLVKDIFSHKDFSSLLL